MLSDEPSTPISLRHRGNVLWLTPSKYFLRRVDERPETLALLGETGPTKLLSRDSRTSLLLYHESLPEKWSFEQIQIYLYRYLDVR